MRPARSHASFYTWLAAQRDRADAVGCLSRRFVVDGGRRWTFTSLIEHFFFGDVHVVDADFRALHGAQAEYKASRKARANQAPEATSDASDVVQRRWYRNIRTTDALPRNMAAFATHTVGGRA